MQYTIRNVPRRIDQAVRKKAKAEGKSINEFAIKALAAAADTPGQSVVNRDFDDLIGKWVEDPAFDEAMKCFERVEDEDLP